MPRITFIDRHGVANAADGDVGQSVMEVAKRAGISGIVGECGGSCACATCHVYVPEAWRALTGEATSGESEMLELAADRRPESRLSCQIRLRTALDGLVVILPERQG